MRTSWFRSYHQPSETNWLALCSKPIDPPKWGLFDSGSASTCSKRNCRGWEAGEPRTCSPSPINWSERAYGSMGVTVGLTTLAMGGWTTFWLPVTT